LFEFPREERLRKSGIRRVFRSGDRSETGCMRLYVIREGAGKKAAFAVRKCRRSAVRRNRYKRLLREIYRLNKHSLRDGIRIFLLLEKPDFEAGFRDLEKEFLTICRKADIVI
jgi:ribonuclease P protein component